MDETTTLPGEAEDDGVSAPAADAAAETPAAGPLPAPGADAAGDGDSAPPPDEADEAALADLAAEMDAPPDPPLRPELPPGPPPSTAGLIEALLFVSKEPLEPARLMEFLDIQEIADLEARLAEVEARLRNDPDRGLLLKRAAGGLQLVTKPDLHEQLKEFFTIRHSAKLTLASLETMAIVAYRQPVTLAEISDMRGVNSSGPVKNLLQKKLIRIAGRKRVPGLPALYATAPEFLVYFGLNDLSELPTLEELTELFEEKEQPSLFKK